ncbi:MAG: hypothetical protein IT538_11000 [Variibacter sp.]|nr:hypothetical protein [Variibacter sp.]
MIHTEQSGHVGYSIAIVFYFLCIAAAFLTTTLVVFPIAKAIAGKAAALVVLSSMLT